MNRKLVIRIHNDYWWAISLLCTIFFIILVGGCTETYDYIDYQRVFEGIYKSWNIEAGYAFFMSFCAAHGISYDFFRLINIAICYLLIARIAYKYVGRYIISIWILYLFSAMAFDAVNLRSLIITTIFIYAFIAGLSGTKKGIIVFVILIAASMLFHKSALFFLICLPAFIKTNNEKVTTFKKRDISIFLAILFFIVIASSPSLLSSMGQLIWKIISTITGISSNKSSYFEVKGHWGFLLYSICHMSFLITIAYLRKKINKYDNCYAHLSQTELKKRKHYLEVLYLCNILIILFLPIIRINSELYRVVRSFQIIEYIGFFYGIALIPKKSQDRIVLNIMIIATAAINFYILVFPYFDEIFITMFNSNLYF